MSFTDKDLKRLKEFWIEEKALGEDRESLLALLARLEAAEAVISIPHRCSKCGFLRMITGKFMNAWRKACGK